MTRSVLNRAARLAAAAMAFQAVQHTGPVARVPRHDTRKEWALIKPNGIHAASMAVHCSPSSSQPKSPYTAAVLISHRTPVVLLEAKEGVTDHKVARDLMLRAFVRWANELRFDQGKVPKPV